MRLRFLFAAIVLLASNALLPAQEKKDQAITPTEVIKPCNGKNLAGLTTWLKKTKAEDPDKVFSVRDGVIVASGADMGYVATDKEYRDYHLVVEYKWGEKTYGAKGVRNSGILLHASGPDGGAGGTWMSCIECQLAQGCVGDLIVIRGKDAKGETIPVQFTSETANGADKHPRWKKGGEARVFTKGQQWWEKHENFFKEDIDTRGKDDVDSALGEWTKVECICWGSRIRIIVNGKTVNECYDVFPAAGKILLQSEGFEIHFRNFELRPLTKAEKPEK
jgi:hypothetical protein